MSGLTWKYVKVRLEWPGARAGNLPKPLGDVSPLTPPQQCRWHLPLCDGQLHFQPERLAGRPSSAPSPACTLG